MRRRAWEDGGAVGRGEEGARGEPRVREGGLARGPHAPREAREEGEPRVGRGGGAHRGHGAGDAAAHAALAEALSLAARCTHLQRQGRRPQGQLMARSEGGLHGSARLK